MTLRAINLLPFRFGFCLLLFCLGLNGSIAAQPSTGAESLRETDIKVMLHDYIDGDKLGVGLVVGIVDEQGKQVVGYGKLDNGTDAGVAGDTLFAIGSVTKVFTALLLQDMVDRGEMKLNDPVQEYMPDSVKLPTYDGKQITLLHLATHTSGLPRDCDGNPYVFLSHCTLHQAPGTDRVYSNLGMGLLGHVIALKAGKDYESLVIERICRPLGMNDTCITLTPGLKTQFATGHVMPGYRVRNFSSVHHDTDPQIPRLLGAGSLLSTANDLLKFVAAYAGISPSPLSPLMQQAQSLHALESGAARRLAWDGEGPVFEHGGLLNGYQAELAFDVKRRRGVVVLSNCSSYGTFVPGVWPALLEGRSPRPSDRVRVDATLYDRYTGLYQLGKRDHCTVRRDGDRLLIQWLGQRGQRARIPSFEVFPRSELVFRNEFREVQATFSVVKNSGCCHVILTSLGHLSGFQGSIQLTRISKQNPAPPVPVRIDSSKYESYVGQYRKTLLFGLIRVGPTLSISHLKDELGIHLIAHVRGLGSEEIFPMSDTSFIPGPTVDGDLKLTFVRNKKGRAKGAVVLWNGKKYRGTRISNKLAQ